MHFNFESANRALDHKSLIEAAELFIATKPGIDRDAFLSLMADYMVADGADRDTIMGVPPAGNIFKRRLKTSMKLQAQWRAKHRQ